MSVTFRGYDARRPHPRVAGANAQVEIDEKRWPGGGMNLANSNARALLALLGLIERGEPSLDGACPLPEARRAYVRARATFDANARRLVRPDVVEHGAPRVGPDGAVELRPIRMHARGIDMDYLAWRLEEFRELLVALADAGATHLFWA